MVNLSDEQLMLQTVVRRMCQKHIAGLAAHIDKTERIPPEVLNILDNQGFFRLMLPEEFGGSNADTVTLCLIIEELAKVCASTAVTLVGHITGTMAFFSAAGEEQKQRTLSPGAGRKIFAIAITEPEAGSDVKGIRTTARPDGDSYILNGAKCFVTNGGIADNYVVFARTSNADQSRISAFLVDRNTPGLTVGKEEGKMGLRGSSTTGLVFDNAKIPMDNRLDQHIDGFQLVMKTLHRMRIIVGAMALGIAGGALDYAIGYIKSRVQFGKPIADFQGIRFMVADMVTRLHASRLLVYDTAQAADHGAGDIITYSSMAKYYASDVAMHVTTNAVQLLGGYGYITDYPVERMMRDAKATQIFEGTNQIQRLIIASRILSQL